MTIVIFKRRSNEETKNQVFGNILPLLVCTFSLVDGVLKFQTLVDFSKFKYGLPLILLAQIALIYFIS